MRSDPLSHSKTEFVYLCIFYFTKCLILVFSIHVLSSPSPTDDNVSRPRRRNGVRTGKGGLQETHDGSRTVEDGNLSLLDKSRPDSVSLVHGPADSVSRTVGLSLTKRTCPYLPHLSYFGLRASPLGSFGGRVVETRLGKNPKGFEDVIGLLFGELKHIQTKNLSSPWLCFPYVVRLVSTTLLPVRTEVLARHPRPRTRTSLLF